MHLELYSSDRVTIEEVSEWIAYRFNDYFAVPTPVAQKVIDEMRRLSAEGRQKRTPYNWDGPDYMSHGPKIDQWISNNFIWKVFIVTPSHVQKARDERPDDDQLIDFLQTHLGKLVWGENDGI